jgi:class 3 adenylate cyclase
LPPSGSQNSNSLSLPVIALHLMNQEGKRERTPDQSDSSGTPYGLLRCELHLGDRPDTERSDRHFNLSQLCSRLSADELRLFPGTTRLLLKTDMSTEINKRIELEIAHVLFIDIVGYSKLSISDQHAAVEELNQVVRASEQFQRAEAASRLLKIPTGDGIALVFYTSPEAPAQCAVEISRALKEHPRLLLRMGIHSGPVSGVVDVNERANLTGAGINIAKRVMDCGDAGHILLSKHVAEDLEEYEQWRPIPQ